MTLRPYQVQTVADLRTSILAGNRRVVVQAPTGSGKTVLAAEIIRSATDKGHGVLFLAPRRELVYQAAAKLARVGVPHAVLMAGEPGTLYERVQVASVPTLHRRAIQGDRHGLPTAHLVVVDEAHLSVTPSTRAILDAYPDAVVVGLTATPARSDGRGLGEFYDALVEGPSVADLTRGGYLVPARYYAPSKPDLEGIHIRRGDYDAGELEERMDRPRLVGDVVSNWLRLASDRPTVAFATSIRHSLHLRDRFLEAGVAAEHLDGATPNDERAAILARLASGETRVVCNCFVLGYGWDCPPVACAVLARPTKSLVWYLQAVGRVLRPHPGKADALVLDHAGAVDELGFADDPVPWSLDGRGRVQERRQAQRKRRDSKPITCPNPECRHVYERRPDCPECGHRPEPRGRPLEFVDGDLAELTRTQRRNARTFTLDEKAAFFGQLKALATERGYREGWAAHKYRAKFGVWPNHPAIRDAEPTDPTPEVRSWVRGQQIRYAKARQAVAA